jgi:hypothetical protein
MENRLSISPLYDQAYSSGPIEPEETVRCQLNLGLKPHRKSPFETEDLTHPSREKRHFQSYSGYLIGAKALRATPPTNVAIADPKTHNNSPKRHHGAAVSWKLVKSLSKPSFNAAK